MPEPLAPAASSAILTTALAASGLDPVLLFAGLCGGYWSLIYIEEPIPLTRRLSLSALSSLIGAWAANWGAAPLAALAASWWKWWPPEAGGKGMAIMIALSVGLLAHRYIGPALMRRAARIDGTEGHP